MVRTISIDPGRSPLLSARGAIVPQRSFWLTAGLDGMVPWLRNIAAVSLKAAHAAAASAPPTLTRRTPTSARSATVNAGPSISTLSGFGARDFTLWSIAESSLPPGD
jgi:hypothetical protein